MLRWWREPSASIPDYQRERRERGERERERFADTSTAFVPPPTEASLMIIQGLGCGV
jgi:hypothetical protein